VESGTAAARGGLQRGDVIVAVNGESVTELNANQCREKLNKANASLYLLLIKYVLLSIILCVLRAKQTSDLKAGCIAFHCRLQ